MSAHWDERPFARTFDLIASEYGWTDDQILDLTMGRVRQVRAVIWERQIEERRGALRDRERELQIMCEFIAGSAGNEAGQKAARAIRLVPDDDGEAPEKPQNMIPYEKARAWFGG